MVLSRGYKPLFICDGSLSPISIVLVTGYCLSR